MSRPTMLAAERAAEMLGIDVYDLGYNLRHAAADALEGVARDVRRDGGTVNVARTRRLLAAAEACEAAWNEVAAAKEGVAS